ncbi:MAG TPA: hypothetical protein VMR02_20875 [Terracidiphilus sp.]|jgi:hypothetical protein|nr:hypothetical protein [Terracidiphilus sp.]
MLELGGFLLDDQHLQAGVLIKARVAGRDHKFAIRMLQLAQLLWKAKGVVLQSGPEFLFKYTPQVQSKTAALPFPMQTNGES